MSNIIKPLDQHVVNVLSVYAMADAIDKQNGMYAYDEYNRIMCVLAEKHKIPILKVCAVFAILSPNATYASNLSSCESILREWAKDQGTAGFDAAKVSTYNKNKIKAWDLMSDYWDDPAKGEWTKGKKTFTFFQNIYNPASNNNGVVVDGHMYSVWMLHQFGMQEAKVGNGRQYNRIAQDIISAAGIVGITPSQMQAVCWFTWKRVNRIAFDVSELQPKLWVEG